MQALPVLQPICCGPTTPPLPAEAREELAARFKALADPTRVAIVNRLAAADEVCVCDLNAAFELSLAKKRRPFQAISSCGESGETLDVPAAVPSLCQRYVCPLVGPGWRMK